MEDSPEWTKSTLSHLEIHQLILQIPQLPLCYESLFSWAARFLVVDIVGWMR